MRIKNRLKIIGEFISNIMVMRKMKDNNSVNFWMLERSFGIREISVNVN